MNNSIDRLRQAAPCTRLQHENHGKTLVTLLPRLFTFALAGVILGSVFGVSRALAQGSPERITTPQRRIPVRGYSRADEGHTRVLTEKPSEQAGRVTSVEIRNADGELVTGELGQDEYFIGSAPPPIQVGQRLPSQLDSRRAEPPVDVGYTDTSDYEDSITIYGESGESYDDSGYLGDGPYRYRPGASVDPRVERLAHVLAYPFAGFWARAEYLRMRLDGQGVPPLVTTSTAGTLRSNAGVLGLASTRTLYGGNRLGEEDRSGGRFEIGRYFGGSGLGISASFLFADDVNDRFAADSSSYGILARPFIDVSPGGLGSDAELVSFPGELTGNVDVRSSTSFSAGDVLLRAMLICDSDRQLEGFVGYTYLSLDDELSIRDFKRVVGGGGGIAIATTLDETDRFAAENDFHAAAFGVRGQTCFGPWSLETMMKLGLGVTSSTVTARGTTTRTVPIAGGTDTATQNTGLLVQNTNAGTRDYDDFAVSPEVRLLLNRRLSRDWSVSVGYQLIYLSRVMRAGEQIDPLLNLTGLDVGGLQGFAAPRRTAFYNDLTAQAITIGILGEF